MASCKKAASKIEATVKIANGATGAASGMDRALTMGFDIPATIALSLRNIKDTGRAYGFEGEGLAEQLFRLQILEIAAFNDKGVRKQRIADLGNTIGDGDRLKQPKSEVAKSLVDQAIERVSRALALAMPRDKAGTVVPLLSAVIDCVENSSFQDDISAAAQFTFQDRRLK